MKQKLFLSSMLIMSVAPAMAETFPSNGLMQENTTYTNAATETNMDGVYEGTVNATAEYENILYQIGTGQYLPAGAESPIDCNVPGSFCPGLSQGVNYDENTPQGLTSCSTATNGEYTLSDGTGTSADSCYATDTVSCSTRNPYVGGHATNVVYGNSTNGNASCKTYYADTNTCILDETDACQITNLTCENGYHKEGGSISLTAQETQKMMYLLENPTIISKLPNAATIPFIGGTEAYNNLNAQDTEALKHGEWLLVSADNQKIAYGTSSCNNYSGTYTGDGDYFTFKNDALKLPTELNSDMQGQNCWCMIKAGKIGQQISDKSSYWINISSYNTANECSTSCTYDCIGTIIFSYNPDSGVSLIESLMHTMTDKELTCSANTITINWSDVDPEYAGQNGEGTATYGSDIKTPVKAQTIKGKTFKGWRFVDPTKTSLSE
jgi:hypothetical protein